MGRPFVSIPTKGSYTTITGGLFSGALSLALAIVLLYLIYKIGIGTENSAVVVALVAAAMSFSTPPLTIEAGWRGADVKELTTGSLASVITAPMDAVELMEDVGARLSKSSWAKSDAAGGPELSHEPVSHTAPSVSNEVRADSLANSRADTFGNRRIVGLAVGGAIAAVAALAGARRSMVHRRRTMPAARPAGRG
jgi:hypothetical protein